VASNGQGAVGSSSNCACLPPSVPFHYWPWENKPIKRFHIDFASIDNLQVLVVLDSHSKWIEAIPIQTATTSTTVEALKSCFLFFCQLSPTRTYSVPAENS